MGAEVTMKSDSLGNRLIFAERAYNTSVTLKLMKETRARNIGNISVLHRIMTVRRVRSKHLHKKSKSYGFNYSLLSEAKLFNTVRLCEKNEYLIPIPFILEHGEFLHFLEQGFEKQIFISLELIKPFIVKPKF